MRKFFCLVLLLFFGCTLEATFGNSFYAGPEIYHMRRWRPGGTIQRGRIDGLRLGYERIKCDAVYLNFDALFAKGTLKGHTGRGRSLRSTLKDHIYEGKIGYTFVKCHPLHTYIIPYVGGGYFNEKNNFTSSVLFSFKDTFKFFSVGFLSGLYLDPCFSIGLEFDLRFMINGKSTVTDDPLYDTVTLIMSDESFYRVEVPIEYEGIKNRFALKAAPFYEHRHFGGRMGFPFDFIDTKFDLIGIQFAISFLF